MTSLTLQYAGLFTHPPLALPITGLLPTTSITSLGRDGLARDLAYFTNMTWRRVRCAYRKVKGEWVHSLGLKSNGQNVQRSGPSNKV